MEKILNTVQKQAINHILVCMLAVDDNIDSAEIQCWKSIKESIGITPEDTKASVLMDMSEAVDVLQSMDTAQKSVALKYFIEMMTADGKIMPEEDQLIQSIIAKCNLQEPQSLTLDNMLG